MGALSEWTLPHLAPLLATATGHTLGTILKSTAAFADFTHHTMTTVRSSASNAASTPVTLDAAAEVTAAAGVDVALQLVQSTEAARPETLVSSAPVIDMYAMHPLSSCYRKWQCNTALPVCWSTWK